MSQWRGAIQEISDVVRRLCRCASDASTSNLSISSGGMLLGLWHETAKQMVLKPENLIASTWKDIDEYRQLMIADSEAVTVIVQHIHQLVLNNAHHLPAVMSELSVGVENCVQRVRMLEATTVLGAIVFQRAGLVAQDRNLLSVAELVSVVYEVLRGLQDLAEIPSKPEELSSPTQERPKKGSWNGVKSVMRKGGFFNPAAVNVPAQTLLSHFAPAPAAENLASHDWSVLNEKLREFNRSAKSLVRAMNYYLDTLLMIEHQLILTGECQTDAAGLGKDALLRMRDTLQAILASQQHNRHTWRISFKEIPQFISISNGSSDQSSDNMEVPVNDSRKHTIDSSAMSDFGRDYPENLKRRSPNPVHSSIQTLCNEGDSRMNSVHNASESYLKHESSNDRGYTLPDKGFDDGNYRQPRSFSMGKPGKQAYRPTKLRRQISAPDVGA
ncbi:hypothetical protein BC832DRAFT_419454 [Gaertneriomyces semiglobifer]|nr:hypothetical protein BC832DRAFT_419454 [Gaertneriomyces semiglobifer]